MSDKMKKELIKTDDYLLVVDDSEIKKGDYFYVTTKNISGGNIVSQSIGNGEFAWNEHILSTKTDERGYHPSHCKKIIAHLPLNNSPILEGVPLLPPLEQEDDAICPYPESKQNAVDWHNGYNKAREKYKFTEEDMLEAFRKGWSMDYDFSEYIKSLSQPKMPTHFEFEETIFIASNASSSEITLTHEGVRDVVLKGIKTTTNSQGQVIGCGKYIY